MINRAAIPWLLALAALPPTYALGQPATQPDAVRIQVGYYPRASGYIHIPLMPRPIQPEAVRMWMRMLHASDEQSQLMWRLYDQYVIAESETHDRFVQPLWDRSAQLRLSFAAQPAPVSVALEYVRLFEDDRDKAVAKVVANEELFFDLLQPILAESQIPLLHSVRAQRSRMRDTRNDAWYPGGSLDITLLIQMLQDPEVDVEPLDATKYAAVIADYDTRATPLFAEAARAFVKCEARSMLILSRAAAGDGNREDLRVEKQRYRLALVGFEKRIHDLNRRVVDELASTLPPQTGTKLQELFRQTVYSPVYPDPSDVDDWFEQVLRLRTLDSNRRETIVLFQSQAASRREQLSNALIDSFLSYREDWGSDRGDRFELYAQGAHAIHAQRIETARAAMQGTLALLSEEEKHELSPTTTGAEKRLTTVFLPDSARAH